MLAPAVTLMWASGFAGLGYQIAWTQQTALWMGHEAASMLAIVAAFFGGLGLGAWFLGRRIDRSSHPARWYAGCELAIGLWGLALSLLMAPSARALLDLLGPQPSPAWQWSVSFGGTFLLLLPATAAMGATLPALERMLDTARVHHAPLALLYAANTFGAVAGVLGTAFILAPRIGFTATTWICAALNLLCAMAAWNWQRPDPPAPAPERPRPIDARPLFTLALTGLLGIGFEVLVVRALSQVAENTVFTFALLLAVYLLGTATGSALYSRRVRDTPVSTATLLRWQALACLSAIVMLGLAGRIQSALIETLPASMPTAVFTETLLGCAAFLLPTLVMGALFSHLVLAARAGGASTGMAIGVNTLAAALAPLLFGVWLLPRFGSTAMLLGVSAAYLLAAGWRGGSRPLPAVAAAALAALMLWHPPVAAVGVPEGGRVLSRREGVAATVTVIEDATGTATLHINNRQQEGSSRTLYSDARQGLLPLLLHPAPRRALFLGLGTGATARSAATASAVQVDAVELLPEVIAAADTFRRLQQSPATPTLRVFAADARRFIRSTDGLYDVIVSDNFHPARSGSAALYTVEHFTAVRERLSADGLFCQWLPLHQMDLATLSSIVRSFTEVYPVSWAMLATNSLDTPVLGLVARRDGRRFTLEQIRARMAAPRTELSRDVIEDELALLGGFIAGPGSLSAFAAGAPLNLDDHPVVSWMAPRATYAPEDTPRRRLLDLLARNRISPAELLESVGNATARLSGYWTARNQYLEIGAAVHPSPDARDMLAQVRQPLLSVLELSPEFRPAYDPLVNMARALARSDAGEARALLTALTELNPAWPEARDALAEIGSGQP